MLISCVQTAYTVEITELNSQGFTSWWQTGAPGAQKINCRSVCPCSALLTHRNGELLPLSTDFQHEQLLYLMIQDHLINNTGSTV